MIINCPLILTTPVAIPLSALLIVLSGLIISVLDTLCIPTTDATWNATLSLLKLVIINISFVISLEGAHLITLAKSTIVIIKSLGINTPSTQGCELGTGVTLLYGTISLILATLIP